MNPNCNRIVCVTGELDYSISIINLGDPGMSDSRLNHMLAHAEHQSIILLEDVDAAFVSRDLTKDSKYISLAKAIISFSHALQNLTSYLRLVL